MMECEPIPGVLGTAKNGIPAGAKLLVRDSGVKPS